MGRSFCRASPVLLVLLLVPIGCDSRNGAGPAGPPAAGAAAPRAAKPLFKGVELYSWRNRRTGSCHFALLPGTNRNKPVSMVLAQAWRIDSPDELKKRLSRYAPREQIFWHSRVDGPGQVPAEIEFGFPDAKLVKDLRDHCRGLDIDLHVIRR